MEGEALFLGKTDRGACRRADRVVGDRLRRAGHFTDNVFLLPRKTTDQAVSRRGVAKLSTITPSSKFSAASNFSRPARRSSSAFGSIPAGISSAPISKSSSSRFSPEWLVASFLFLTPERFRVMGAPRGRRGA